MSADCVGPFDSPEVNFSPYRTVASAIVAVWRDFVEIEFGSARAAQASMAALVVAVSVGVACAMHLQEVWWAAISGFISSQATRPASVKKALLRVTGTMAGAALCLALVGWLAYDMFACVLALFVISSIGILGVNVSPHGYAWLFFSVTFSLVLLMSLVDPLNAFSFAINRTIEVVIGATVAIAIAFAMAPEESVVENPAPRGWTDLFDAQWPVVLHALRGGIAVAMTPIIWSYFYLPGVSATATTMTSVLAVPVLSDNPMDSNRKMVEKAMHRLLGCLVGGVAGLMLLAVPLTQLLPWLTAVAAGTWSFAYLQGSTRGIGYIGTQAAVVFIITLVQGDGPPTSIMPGINRFAGIAIGMMTLFIICILLQPKSDTQPPAAANTRTRARRL
jgi:uncharacterized membrane protein YccC